MAEALGLASSIVALVQLSASVYSATSKFYREAKEAKSKIGALATQTMNLSGVLHSLSLLASSPLFDDAGASGPDFRDTYIESCLTTLNKIRRKLEKAERDLESGNRKKIITRSLKWPFASQETDDLIAELGQHRDVLQLALSADTMSHLLQCLANTKGIADSVDILNQKLERKTTIDTRARLTAKREEIVRFFLKVNPETNLQDCRTLRHPSTGRWLIETNEVYRHWVESPGSQIWLSGIPGAGKTILCGTVVEDVLQKQSASTAVAFFFCNYNSTQSQEPVNVLGALAVQLAKQANAAFDVLESYYEQLHPENGIGRPPDTDGMIDVARVMIEEYDKVYLVIDGLDECGSRAVEVIQSLQQVQAAGDNQVAMALFSRNEPDIMDELADSTRIEIAAQTEDLELYVLSEMETRKNFRSLAVKNPELHKHILKTLIEGANGMFRWVACQLDHLDRLPSDGRRRKALNELPPTLFETYDRILDRIMQEDEHEQELCRKALHWIGLGHTEISPPALCEAISIEDDMDAVDGELLVDPDWVSRTCSSLVRPAGQESWRPHFELAHFTVKEYLRSIKPQSTRRFFRFSEDEAMRQLVRTSLRFLTFPIFKRKPMIASSELEWMDRRNEQHPFYPVAAVCLIYWMKGFEGELELLLEDEVMMQYARDLFTPDKTGNFLSWVLQAMWYQRRSRDSDHELNDFHNLIGFLFDSGFSTLHVAAILALPSICTYLIDMKNIDPNMCCPAGTPFHALLAGTEFLSWMKRASSWRDYAHRHPSSKSISYVHTRQCLETFLQHGADTSIRWKETSTFKLVINNSKGTCSSTKEEAWILPLINQSTVVEEDDCHYFSYLLRRKEIHPSVVDVIFTLGSDPNSSSGWTRLASIIHKERMRESQNESDGEPVNIQGRLSDEDFADGIRISVDQNLTNTLRSLVQDPRFRPDLSIGSMPVLQYAIRPGGLKSIELLLGAGCDPKVVNDRGWTTLHKCACSDTKDAAITSLFLKLGVSDTVKAKWGETCWHIAAEEDNVTVLKVLIDLGSDTKQSLALVSDQGRTPLSSAILHGNLKSALLLLDHCSTDFEALQGDESLLDQAAAVGSFDLFKGLHEKLKEANATEALQDSKPFDHIDMRCSPELLRYLMECWPIDSKGKSHVLEKYLLDANNDRYKDLDISPGFHMTLVIQELLSPRNATHDDGMMSQHPWEVFCVKVLPNLTQICDHQKHHCRSLLINMMFEALIEAGVLASNERDSQLPSHRVFFEGLLARGDGLECSWVAPSVGTVITATGPSIDLAKEEAATELLSEAVRLSNIDLVRQLLSHGADVHASKGHLSPLEQACYSSDLKTFQLIIGHLNESLINRAGSKGKTLLHWTITRAQWEYLSLAKIRRLLRLGANIESRVDDTHSDTPLTLACWKGCQAIVELLISQGADPLQRGLDGWSILHAAAVEDELWYIERLIPLQALPSFWLGTCKYPLYDKDGIPQSVKSVSVMHLAARYGRSGLVQFMIQNKLPLDINSVTAGSSFTPLHLACWFGHIDVVKDLVSLKARINERDANGLLPIDLAANEGHLEIVETLLRSGSERPSSNSSDKITGLMVTESGPVKSADESAAMSPFDFERAIIRGNLRRCKELVASGLSINAEFAASSYTPLLRAIIEEQTHIVDWLVSIGVEVTDPFLRRIHPSLRGIASLTTYHIRSPQTLTAILDLALRQNTRWCDGLLSPLHVAILDENMEALDVILQHIRENDHAYRMIIDTEMISVPAGNTDWLDRSALSILTSSFNQEGAFWYRSLWEGEMPPGSPLHWALRYSDRSAVRLLLQNEADVNQVDSAGCSPLSLAVRSSHPKELLGELLRAGAGLSEPRTHWIHAMNSAIIEGNLDVVKALAEVNPGALEEVDEYFSVFMLSEAGSMEVFQYLISQGFNPLLATKGLKHSAVSSRILPTSPFRGSVFNSGLVPWCSEEALANVLHFAAHSGGPSEVHLIKKLHRVISITTLSKVVNSAEHGYGSPSCRAASMNNRDLLMTLLAMGAEINSEGSRFGSPLMAACAWGSLDAVKCLVRSGAQLHYVNQDGELRSAVSLSCRHEKIKRWLLVGRHTEQEKLDCQPSQSTPHQAVWGGPRLFKLALPAYMQRDFDESRWSHLQRLEKWKKDLLGCTLNQSRRNSGLDFDAELAAESRERDAQAAHRRFLARLGDYGSK